MYFTLEELAGSSAEIDRSEFGAKIQGVVDLIRLRDFARDEFNLEYRVPEGFGIPSTSAGEHLIPSYARLMQDEVRPMAVVVRSSDPAEAPGQFETRWVLHDPGDERGTLQRLEEAFDMVRCGTRRPVMVQKAAISQIDARYAGDYDVAIMARSHAHDEPSKAVINACWGLTTKLVDNPDEICIVKFNGRKMEDHVHTGINHAADGATRDYRQNELDVFDISAGRVRTLSADNRICPLQWSDIGVLNIEDFVSYLSEQYGVPVELEGTITKHEDLHLFQLTKSHFIPTALEKVSDAPENLIYRGEVGTVGSLYFSGDILIYNKNTCAVELAIQSLPKDNLAVVSPEFPDGFGVRTYVKARSLTGVRSDLGRSAGSAWGSSLTHEVGWLNTQLYQRHLKGDSCCAVLEDLNLTIPYERGRTFVCDEFMLLRGATMQAAAGIFQISYSG